MGISKGEKEVNLIVLGKETCAPAQYMPSTQNLQLYQLKVKNTKKSNIFLTVKIKNIAVSSDIQKKRRTCTLTKSKLFFLQLDVTILSQIIHESFLMYLRLYTYICFFKDILQSHFEVEGKRFQWTAFSCSTVTVIDHCSQKTQLPYFGPPHFPPSRKYACQVLTLLSAYLLLPECPVKLKFFI